LKPFSRGNEIHNLKQTGYQIIEKINKHKSLHGNYPNSIEDFPNSSKYLESMFEYKIYKNESKDIEIFGNESFILEIRPTFILPYYYYYNKKSGEFETTD